jgi:hypothetical protein
MQQPEVAILNDFQTILLIQNGAIILEQEEDFGLPITYRAIAIDNRLAYMRSTQTGQILIEDTVLMTIVNSIMAMCV